MIQLFLLPLFVGVSVSAPHHETTYPLPHPAPIKKPSVVCKTEYATVWDTEYKETETQVCTTEYDKHCKTEYQALCLDTVRTECQTLYESKCETIYNTVCVEQYKTEYEPYIESECTTEYRTDCEYRWEGEGNSKIWAPIPGTCKDNPYDACKDIPKTKERQVAYPVCNQVPQEKCVDVPRQACQDIPEQKCVDQPHEICQDIPRENCHNEHKKVPVRVSRKIPKQVCIHTDGYHTHQPTPAVPLPHHPAVPAAHHPHHSAAPVSPLPHHPGVIPAAGVIIPGPILPTPAPAIAVLPNIVLRTPKAAKDIEEVSKRTEANKESNASDKLVHGQEDNEKPKKNKKTKSKSAVVFRN